MRSIRFLITTVATLCITFSATAQQSASTTKQPAQHETKKFDPAKMDTILYGAAFYEEYMPYDRLDTDVEMMQKAGLNVVRIGESTWSLWEPQDGQFQFAWMDRIVDKLSHAGIKIIMGTPTYSIPPWMYKEHPEVLVTKLGEQKSYYGIRQNMDITSPTYRFYSERVIRKIVEHYKDNPDIIGYQIDNETAPYYTAGPALQANFIKYLQARYKTVDTLNKIWGLNYWGQTLHGWDEVPPMDGIINPGWKLEWERYQQSLVTDFLGWQANIVNQYKRPDQFVTQDFGGPTRPFVNEEAISKHLDIAAMNAYHLSQDHFDGQDSSYAGDYARSLKHTNYLITETNAQTIGWNSALQYPPYDGQMRLDVYTHLSSGANMVEYWHWHSIHYGQETYWKGILSHDLQPNRAYAEVSRTAHELQRIGPQIVDLQHDNQVAILYSNDSRWTIRYMPFSVNTSSPFMAGFSHDEKDGYDTVLHQMYAALYKLNVGVDFIFPDTTDLSHYKVIVVPPLYSASDAVLNRLADYVEHGGHLVVAFKSGFTNEYSTVRWTMAPGPLRKAAGFRYQEFSNLEKPLALKGDPFHVGAENQVSDWAEMLILEGAKPLAYYDHPFFGKYPAITENHYGTGTLTYEGTLLSEPLQQAILKGVLQEAGLTGPDQQLPATVRIKHGTNRNGKTILYYMNYSSDPQSFAYPYSAGTELLSQKAVAPQEKLTLGPWDVAIIEEK